MAKVEKTYKAVCDFLAQDQFLDCCSHELYLYLKPKPFKVLGEIAHEADLFADAKGGVPLCVSKGHRESKGVDQAQPKVEPKQDLRPLVKCKICGKPHPTYKCWNNPNNKKVASSAEFNSQYRGDNPYRDQVRNFGRVDQRDNHYNGHYDDNYRTDHQVIFCKIESLDVEKGQAKFSSPHSSSEVLPRKDSMGTCHFPRSRLPTAIGTVYGKEIRVLRDTGCTGVVERRSLVSDGQMLNKQSGVTLINNYKQRCPVARINIECPFFRGSTDALCIEDPLHDLVIGNIEWSKFPDMTHFSSGVVKNKQSRKERRKNRKVKVADKFIRQNRQELVLKQASDVKLADIRRRVESGSVTKSRKFSSGETKFIRRNGLIYRHFKKNAKVSLQLVIPSSLTHSVINLAHESLRVLNHRGRKETISKVLEEFYWPVFVGR